MFFIYLFIRLYNKQIDLYDRFVYEIYNPVYFLVKLKFIIKEIYN